jgi:hypothetical protein
MKFTVAHANELADHGYGQTHATESVAFRRDAQDTGPAADVRVRKVRDSA